MIAVICSKPEMVSLPDHKGLGGEKVNEALAKSDKSKSNIFFFKVKTPEGIEMDAWRVMPDNFDSTKKYPVVFYVYTEPWGQNVKDQYGVAQNFLCQGDMAKDGYVYISIDNRGTPVPIVHDFASGGPHRGHRAEVVCCGFRT